MAYLTATRYGLTKLRFIPEYMREAGWEPGWRHDATGMYVLALPGPGERVWKVADKDWQVLSGWSSSLRAAAKRIERLARQCPAG